MKTTTVNTHSIVQTIAGSSQRGAREYQRKPAFYQMAAGRVAAKVVAPSGLSFREILEREVGGGASKQAVKAVSQSEAETTQLLSGYWA